MLTFRIKSVSNPIFTRIVGCSLSKPKTAGMFSAVLFVLLLSSDVVAQFNPCIAPDNGNGTVTLPPSPCGYMNPDGEFFEIINGLPAGSTIEIKATMKAFVCQNGCSAPGGFFFGGQEETYNATMVLELKGTGDLAGFNRIINAQVAVVTHSGPRNPGDPVQSFPTDIFSLIFNVPQGDPDFLELFIAVGSGLNRPSFGNTTLTRLGPPGSDFQVDSFFDVTYQLSYAAAPGSVLQGSAITEGTTRLEAGLPLGDPCEAPDNTTGTADLPPFPCDYAGLGGEAFKIIDGLDPGTTLELVPTLTDFMCPGGPCGAPGGIFNGELEQYNATLRFDVTGTGTLNSFQKTLSIPVTVETHSGPRTPGDPVQVFPTDMASLQGTLPPGDPDFANLIVTAGTANGLPSPGFACLIDQSDGTFRIDSFFDIEYQVFFLGEQGGLLDGLSGTTTGRTKIEDVLSTPDGSCVSPDNDNGTILIPPNCDYIGEIGQTFQIIDGLPPATTIKLDPTLTDYMCGGGDCGQPGGDLGGEQENFTAILDLQLMGTGSLTGFQRDIQVPVTVETHSGPRSPGDAIQIFGFDMNNLLGDLPQGDPDFDQLTITIGSDNGLPSPGNMTLTRLNGPGADFQVDSFFDIDYRIDFVGAPGGQLDGMSGSTTGEIRLKAVQGPPPPPPQDFGDAPASYGTELPNGARHLIVDQPVGMLGSVNATTLSGHHNIGSHIGLGQRIDPELNGQPTEYADGDDANDPNFDDNHNDNGGLNDNGFDFPQDDEDGVFFKTLLVKGNTAEIRVTVPGNFAIAIPPGFSKSTASDNTPLIRSGFNLDAWIDFNQNDVFDHPDELLNLTNVNPIVGIPTLCGSYHIYPGVSTLQFDVPQNAVAGHTYARFRVSTAGCLEPTGPARDGEVEDYQVVILDQQPNEFDFGDAEDSYGTTLAVDGARHPITQGINLGPTIDGEPDGFPTPGTDGDDLNNLNDEDGVVMPLVIVRGGDPQTVIIDGGPNGGLLDTWVDSDFNGIFDHPFNHSFGGVSQLAFRGPSSPIGFTVPLAAPVGLYNFRFRISSTGGLLPTGPAPDGEVEDYQAWLVDQIDNVNDFIAPEAQLAFWNGATKKFSFHLAITNTGNQPMFAPLFIEIVTLNPGPPQITIDNPDAGGTGIGATFDFSHLLGPDNQLDPGEQTSFRHVVFNDDPPVIFSFFADVFSSPVPIVGAGNKISTEIETPPISFFGDNATNDKQTQQSSSAKSTSSNSLGFRVDVTNNRLERITITDVGDESVIQIPEEFGLDQNYPNPFNPETTIRFQLPQASEVIINVYNLQGQLIRSLVSENKEAGYHEIVWDARDDAGRTMPSGVYLYRIKASDFTEVKKLMLIR